MPKVFSWAGRGSILKKSKDLFNISSLIAEPELYALQIKRIIT
jgi:hypothetical protein